MTRWTSAIFLLMLCSGSAGALPASADPLQQAAEHAMRDAGVVGMAIARLDQAQVAELRTYGLRDGSGAAVTSTTIFQAASLGKIAVSYAALILVQQGKLTLDQRLTDPRIAITTGCTAPTVRSVLTHTSGMGNDLTASRFAVSCEASPPFRYSGQGFLALATEMERATGIPTPQLVEALVFSPLGMSQTRFGPAIHSNDVAEGHISLSAFAIGQAIGKPTQAVGVLVIALLLALIGAPAWFAFRRGWRAGIAASLGSASVLALFIGLGLRKPMATERAQPADMVPASLTSSIGDLGRFAAELLAPQLLPAARVEQWMTEQVSVTPCIGWSLLMGTDHCDTHATAWQWGSNLGFQSLLVLEPQRRRGLVILTNSGGGLDTVFPGQGGYPAAKRLASDILGIKGRWDVRN